MCIDYIRVITKTALVLTAMNLHDTRASTPHHYTPLTGLQTSQSDTSKPECRRADGRVNGGLDSVRAFASSCGWSKRSIACEAKPRNGSLLDPLGEGRYSLHFGHWDWQHAMDWSVP